MGNELHSVKQILKAIENSGGIKTNVAKKLGISRHTVSRYQRVYPSVAQALQTEMDTVRDKAESNIFHEIQNGDIPLSQWLLRYKGRYNETTELKHTGDIKLEYTPAKYSEDEDD